MPAPAGPTPKALILELLSTLREGAMPVRALVAAGEVFGIAENSVRVTLARLLAEGMVERDRRARYRLGEGAQVMQRRVVSWRRLEERVRPWQGGWIAAYPGGLRPRPERAARRRGEKALRLLGLRELAPGLAVRPDNLAVSSEETRAELQALGLDPQVAVFRLTDLDAHQELRARRLWDGTALSQGYRRGRRALERSRARLRRLDRAQAMVESFQVGGRVIRQLVQDPLLPDPIVSTRERAALGEAMRAYDRLGRAHWAGFLARFDVPHLRLVADRDVARLAAAGGSA